ncbi:MAG: hypothetical protein QOC71_590 [Thermoplasmata archaeon]|nr:hypothetical protein [Thermoplasmata archaeon]
MPGPVVAGRVRVALGHLRKARAALRQDPLDAKALHAFRKQARRTWAAVQLTEAYLTPVQFARVGRFAAPLAGGLGRLRDEDVLAKRLAALARGKSKPLQDDLLGALRRLPAAERKRRVARAVARAKPKRIDRPVAEALTSMRKGWLDPLGLARARLRERSRWVSAASSVEALHALRLELKAYRYAVEALGKEASRLDTLAAAQARKAAKVLGRVMDAHALAGLAATARPRAAKTLRAAARRDAEAARSEFGKGWTGGWPALRQVVL